VLDEIVDNRYLGGDTEGRGYDDYTTTTEHLTSSKTHPPYEYSEAEFKCHLDQTLNNQHFVVLDVGRHTKTTKAGRVFSFSATVVDGNGEGRGGWGYGTGPTLLDAVGAARTECEKNSFFIDRYQDCYISESIYYHYKKCKVFLFALGRDQVHPTSSFLMRMIFNIFGLKNIGGKWLGSVNKTKRIKTLFMALQQLEHPDFQSEKLGMKLYKPERIPRKHGRVWTYA